MPTRLRPCATPGCPKLVFNGHCLEHVRRRWHHDVPSRHQRGYGSSWDKVRALVLKAQPVCQECHRHASTSVDHIVPKSQGGDDRLSNLRGLCRYCQQQKAGREGALGRARHLPYPGVLGRRNPQGMR